MPDFEMPPIAPTGRRGTSASSPAAAGEAAQPLGGSSPLEHPSSPDAADTRPRSWRRRLRVPIAASLVGAVVAVGGVAAVEAVLGQDARAQVEAVVADYVALVEAADGATIASDPRLDEATATRTLLAAGIAPVARASISCDPARIGDGIAAVDCVVRVEQRRDPARLLLDLVDGRWTITDGVEVPVRIRSGALVVETVDGASLDGAIASGAQAAWLLPGRYEVTVRTPAQLEIEQLEGLVVSGSSGAVRWTSDTTDALDADVQARALAYLEACVVTMAEGCPTLQDRDPADRFAVRDVLGRVRLDDPHALSFDVSVARPADEPEEFLVVTVRIDFGEDLAGYDVTVE